MAEAETSLDGERQLHRYLGRDIPWYIHACWIVFGIFVIYYVVTWLIPALQTEVETPG